MLATRSRAEGGKSGLLSSAYPAGRRSFSLVHSARTSGATSDFEASSLRVIRSAGKVYLYVLIRDDCNISVRIGLYNRKRAESRGEPPKAERSRSAPEREGSHS